MSFNLGINVVEVDGRATPSIQAAATSVTGFSIKAQRGIAGQVVRITNWGQFLEHFGDYSASANGAYCVRGFFDNGGTTAYITRVVHTGTSAATAASISSNNGPWNLTGADSLSFDSDILGSPLNAVFTFGPAVLQGGTGPFDLSANTDITFIVNGAAGDTYSFVAADFVGGLASASVEEVAAVLNREVSGARAWVEGGALRVGTDRGDTAASISASGSAAGVLALDDDGLVNGSGNVANINAVTVAEAVSVINNILGPEGFSVTQSGSQLVIEHPNTGAAHWLQVVDMSDAVPGIFGFDNLQHAGSDDVTTGAAVASSQTFGSALTVTAGYRGVADVGAWGDGLSIEIGANVDDPTRFDLIVSRGESTLETWSGLSMSGSDAAYVETRINDEFSGSKFIIVSASGAVNPALTPASALTGGSDGAFADRTAEVNAYAASIDLFELFEIQLLCCPEAHEAAVVSKGVGHSEKMGDRMFVGHTPRDMEAASIKDAYSKNFQGKKIYGALYFPWIQVADPIGTRRWIPPTGHTLGVFARTERERGIWKAPAGSAARLSGALDVKYHITDTDHTSLVKSAGVNAVRFISGQGIVIDSSRTLSTNALWLYVNVRLLFNFVKSSLKNGLKWVVQEPNTPELWNKVKYNSVTPFLMGLWRRGAFGPGGPEEVFTVKVDAENNPPANIQQGIFTVEVYFYPSRPAETIIITVGQQMGGGSAGEG